MPLHTEYRVFYDFDKKEVVGIANYWNPEVMTLEVLRSDDYFEYEKVRNKIKKEYDEHKQSVVNEVHKFLKNCETLQGKWSIDVMKNGDDFWLIDIARMERSALVDLMENINGGRD